MQKFTYSHNHKGTVIAELNEAAENGLVTVHSMQENGHNLSCVYSVEPHNTVTVKVDKPKVGVKK